MAAKKATTAAKKKTTAAKPSAIQKAIDAAIKKNEKPVAKGALSNAGTLTPAQAAQVEAGVMPTKAAAIAAASPTAAATVIPTDDQWLATDSTYQDELSSFNKSLADSLADSTKQRTDYDTSYNDDLRQLGYVQGGGWNTADPLTQSGKAFSSQTNDFAARGMLQSTGYGDAITNTTRQLDQQVADAGTARQTYDSGLDSYDSAQQSSNVASIAQAKQAAIARKAAQYATAASGAVT